MLRAEMSLHVGYVNVQGLSLDSWNASCSLLESTVDYLFVAETWFVEHKKHSKDRRLVASTPKPRANLMGRSRGGIYLLGTYDARSRARNIMTTEHTITFSRDDQVISGVYLPPKSLSPSDIQIILDELPKSTVLLGDINARFKDPIYQSGQSGPPERVSIFMNFLSSAGLVHVKPEIGRQMKDKKLTLTKLTTDHCFVSSEMKPQLHLLDNHSLSMDSDHGYTIRLTIPMDRKQSLELPAIRFRTSRLRQPDVLESVIRVANSVEALQSDDVEVLNAHLVKVCQEIAELTMGRVRLSQSHVPKKESFDQTYRSSVRLYKEAARTSKENDVIMPTARAQEQGIDAMMENIQMFETRYLGRECPSVPLGEVLDLDFLAREKIIDEIDRQETEKACGIDGMHIRFLKAKTPKSHPSSSSSTNSVFSARPHQKHGTSRKFTFLARIQPARETQITCARYH
jgi:hypothetical protein